MNNHIVMECHVASRRVVVVGRSARRARAGV